MHGLDRPEELGMPPRQLHLLVQEASVCRSALEPLVDFPTQCTPVAQTGLPSLPKPAGAGSVPSSSLGRARGLIHIAPPL